ncbi:bestrophin-3 [Trichonephila clavipes]|nr:bestrophin-3 [Trichonephila clavipes]
MTITYQKNVSNTSFMGFAKLLFKWKGSIYKLVFKELLMYGSAFALISICYRFYMTDEQKRQFEKVAMYCNQTAGLMPMSFVLGFYVTFVVTRWWNQFLNLPWPDRAAHTVLMYMHGSDERGRILRRTLVRYINLANAILFQTISGSAKKRFPTMTHLVGAATRGLLVTGHVIWNYGQETWTTPKRAPPLLTTIPHQWKDVSALYRFNMHHCPTRRVFSGSGLELVTRQAMVRYLYHSATAATVCVESLFSAKLAKPGLHCYNNAND